jgi:hypothetical protein
MGVYNASAACRVAPDKLPAAPRHTLIVMALMSLDASTERQQARVYYGGWQMCCIRMGLLPSDDMRRRFVRDIATLRKLGIVETLEPGFRGHTASYRLILPVDNSLDFVDNGE